MPTACAYPPFLLQGLLVRSYTCVQSALTCYASCPVGLHVPDWGGQPLFSQASLALRSLVPTIIASEADIASRWAVQLVPLVGANIWAVYRAEVLRVAAPHLQQPFWTMNSTHVGLQAQSG